MGYWESSEPYWSKVNIYDGPTVFARSFDALPTKVRTLVAAHWCESEVSNGGLYQFFDNPTGVLAPEAAQAFRDLDLPDLAELLEEAMAFFPQPYPREQARRAALLPDPGKRPRREWDPFSSLDDRFYAAAGVGLSGGPDKDRLYTAMDRLAQGGP